MEYNKSFGFPNLTGGELHDDEEEGVARGFIARWDTFPVIIAILIIAANILVMHLVARNRRLRTITNSFLVSFAASDLIAGAVAIPCTLHCSATYDLMFCAITTITWRFTSISSVLHLFVITMDRYAAIVHAIRYNTLITKKIAVASIASIWAISILMALIQVSWWPSGVANMTDEEKEEFEMHTMQASAIYHIVTLILFFGIPLLVLVFSYVRIFTIVRYHEKQIEKVNRPAAYLNAQDGDKKSKSFTIQAQWKSAIIFLVMLVVFVVCWFPFYMYKINEIFGLFNPPHWVEYVFFYYPRYFTSLANPILYILGKHDFRKTLFPPKRESRTQTTSLLEHRQSNAV